MDEGTQSDQDPPKLAIVIPMISLLGISLMYCMLQEHTNSSIVGQTVTTTHHEELLSLGIRPVVKSNQDGTPCFPYVIFCAPPSGSLDYAGEVRWASFLGH